MLQVVDRVSQVTSVTFECIGGVRADDPMTVSKNGAPNIEMPLSREQQQAVLAHQARAEELIQERLQGQSRDEFFLPNVGQKIDFPVRRRASSESRNAVIPD